MAIDYSPLFAPYTIKGMTVPTRFVMPPMQIGWVTESGAPLPHYIPYFCERVDNGVGLVIAESTAVDHPSSTGHPRATRMIRENISAWSQVVSAVHRSGGRMLVQLWHEGAMRKEGNGPSPDYPTLSPSGLARMGYPVGRACTAAELDEIKRAFVEGAMIAQQCGFDGIELHGAHGYLLDTFLWGETNLREDGYGGSLEQRTRFPAEIISEIRHATGPDFVIGFRFSQWKEVDFSAKMCPTPEQLGIVLNALKDAGVDVLHASARRFYDVEFDGSALGVSGWAKRLTSMPVIAVGSVGLDIDLFNYFFDHDREPQLTSLKHFADLVERFEHNEFDMIAIGRSLLADPKFLQKMRDGKYEDIVVFTKEAVQKFKWNPGIIGEVNGFAEISAEGVVPSEA